MASTQNEPPFELTFWGGVSLRYKRNHQTMKSAKAEALRVLAKLDNRSAHPAVIYAAGKSQPVAMIE